MTGEGFARSLEAKSLADRQNFVARNPARHASKRQARPRHRPRFVEYHSDGRGTCGASRWLPSVTGDRAAGDENNPADSSGRKRVGGPDEALEILGGAERNP